MRKASKQPRVALFTPLPPSQTGTADYGASLAAEMEKLVSLTVYEKAPASFDPERFDHVVYQVGNNPYHADIYELALQHPGVVVLHEASVHYLVRSLTLNKRAGDSALTITRTLWRRLTSDTALAVFRPQ